MIVIISLKLIDNILKTKEEKFYTLGTQKLFCGIGSYYLSMRAYAVWSTSLWQTEKSIFLSDLLDAS